MIESGDRVQSLESLAEICERASSERNLSSLKQKFLNFSIPEDEEIDATLRTAVEKEIRQILASQTLERAKHYVKILRKGLSDSGTGNGNGLNLSLWKGYDHIYTDSLWLLGMRVSNSAHKAWYWGNFVPQIPFQLISRYTSPGDWILDPFCGSGTSLVEARKLGRNSLGIELNHEVYVKTGEILSGLEENGNVQSVMAEGDSLKFDYSGFLKERGIDSFRLAIMHPPYWDIIKFSENRDDLSTSSSMEDFTGRLGLFAGKIKDHVGSEGHIALVIGDLYRNGEVVPLGFKSMEALQDLGLKLRGIIVKDIQNTRAKRTSEALWRYRALKSGFYVFKHEYIFVFKVP